MILLVAPLLGGGPERSKLCPGHPQVRRRDSGDVRLGDLHVSQGDTPTDDAKTFAAPRVCSFRRPNGGPVDRRWAIMTRHGAQHIPYLAQASVVKRGRPGGSSENRQASRPARVSSERSDSAEVKWTAAMPIRRAPSMLESESSTNSTSAGAAPSTASAAA